MSSSVAHAIAHNAVKDCSVENSSPNNRMLTVGESKRSGLILGKLYHAEFAGPGAAVGCSAEQKYSFVLALGSPELIEVCSHDDRQKAYSRRIQWVRWLNKATTQGDPAQRLEKLMAGFEEFFGSEILINIPDEVIALLAGVLPQTVAHLRSPDSLYPTLADFASADASDAQVRLLDERIFYPPLPQSVIPVYSNFTDQRRALSYSA